MSNIEWTERTWNPIVGCTKVSTGCSHCYAETMAVRLKAMGMPQYQDVVNEKGWTGKVQLVESALNKPLKRKKPTVYFVNSMSDLFHKSLSESDILMVLSIIKQTPQHTYQVLTKRPERMKEIMSRLWFDGGVALLYGSLTLNYLPNLWLGVSVENQNHVDRIDYLRQIPAQVRFLSCEPLLGNLELNLTGIHWVIVGGESGSNCRPIKPEWVENIKNQCEEKGVAFFFKQWGGKFPKANGNLLNGKVYQSYP